MIRVRADCSRSLVWVPAALLLCAAAASAQQEAPTKYVVSLTTQTTAMPFKMPRLPNMPKIPGVTDMMAPQRQVSAFAEYPHRAVEPIFVTVPADLKLRDNKLNLSLPKAVTMKMDVSPDQTTDVKPNGGTKSEFRIRLYWHPDSAAGPISNTLSNESAPLLEFPRRGGGGFAPELSRIGSDPAKRADGGETKLPANAVGRGEYVLNTGGASAPLDGFLPALNVKQPEGLADVKLSEGIDVQWDPVPGARGFILYAFSTKQNGKNSMTMTRWVSTQNEPPERIRSDDYEQATTIADDLQAGILLPPQANSCRVPGGIFEDDAEMFTLSVIAVGNDYYDHAQGITVVGKIRAKWQAMKMKGLGGMPTMPGSDTGDKGADD